MSVHTLTPRTVQNIQLTPVSRTEWTVVDTRFEANEARSLIGFIQLVGDRFEVLEFGDPVKFSTAPTMNAALAHLSRASRSAKPIHAA